jgi:hypothetical protein
VQAEPFSAETAKGSGNIPGGQSDRLDVLRAGALGSLAFGVFHRLTFAQVVEAGSFHRGLVKEQFLAVPGNKTKALVRNKFLNCTLCHNDSI